MLVPAQAAEELNVKPNQIHPLIKTCELRAIQIGGRGMWLVGLQDIEDYIAEADRPLPGLAVLFVGTRPVDAIVFHHDLLGAHDPKSFFRLSCKSDHQLRIQLWHLFVAS